MIRCKILEVGSDDMLKKMGFIGKKGWFNRDEYKPRKWLSGWFLTGSKWFYFLQVRIEPNRIWK